MLLLFLTYLIATVILTGGEELCRLKPLCGESCDRTCDNSCGCEGDTVAFGGNCVATDFCDGNSFENKTQCIESKGDHPSCPQMVSTEELINSYTTYDYRIDVRSIGEWDQGHANVSLHTPGLSAEPATQYLETIGGLEDKTVIVYCRSGGRAFAASRNLLRYGFRKVTSFYDGGFPNLRTAIVRDSLKKLKHHPTKGLCYVSGSSSICPQPLPFSHIRGSDDIRNLGERVILVDVRPVRQFPETLKNAKRATTKKVDRFIHKVGKDATLVFFCQKGLYSFQAAKRARAVGWTGPLYWIDNAGYPELKDIPGIEDI